MNGVISAVQRGGPVSAHDAQRAEPLWRHEDARALIEALPVPSVDLDNLSYPDEADRRAVRAAFQDLCAERGATRVSARACRLWGAN